MDKGAHYLDLIVDCTDKDELKDLAWIILMDKGIKPKTLEGLRHDLGTRFDELRDEEEEE